MYDASCLVYARTAETYALAPYKSTGREIGHIVLADVHAHLLGQLPIRQCDVSDFLHEFDRSGIHGSWPDGRRPRCVSIRLSHLCEIRAEV